MLAGMDYEENPEDLITMEAMSGRAKIFDQIDKGHVRPILINVALRITKRCTDIVYSCVACNFNSSLFVFICMSANTKCACSRIHSIWKPVTIWEWSSQVPFLEQIQTNFVSLLLHLNETDPVITYVSCSVCVL